MPTCQNNRQHGVWGMRTNAHTGNRWNQGWDQKGPGQSRSESRGNRANTTTPKHTQADNNTYNQGYHSKTRNQGANPGVAFATVATTRGVSRLPMHHEHKDHIALRFPCDFDATKGDTSTP